MLDTPDWTILVVAEATSVDDVVSIVSDNGLVACEFANELRHSDYLTNLSTITR